MIYRIISSILLTAIAMLLGEWTGYVYTSYAFAAIGSLILLKGKPDQLLFVVGYKDHRRMSKSFEALEIAAWMARPAILLLDKHRPSSTENELRLIYEAMNDNMASLAGPERELIRYLHRIATVPMFPKKAFEIHSKYHNSKFSKKRATEIKEIALNGAAQVVFRINSPSQALNWYVINAYHLGISPILSLKAIIMRYENAARRGHYLAMTAEEYPYTDLEGMGTTLAVPEELKNNDQIITLMTEIEAWRRTFSTTDPETHEQQYDRIMKPVIEAEQMMREAEMYG